MEYARDGRSLWTQRSSLTFFILSNIHQTQPRATSRLRRLIGFLFFTVHRIISTGILVLLIFGHDIVHVGFGFGEFHFVHAFTGVPVQESLALEHAGELHVDASEELLDGGGVTNERGRHLQSLGRNITDGRLDVARNPLDEEGAVLGLHGQHLLFDFLHRDATTEDGGNGEVASVTRIGGLWCKVSTFQNSMAGTYSHHVLGVKHLVGQFGDRQGAVRLGAARGQRSEANHEEVETREGNHVDGELSQVSVQLTRETQAGGDTGHDGRDQVVQVTVGGRGQLEGAETNIVQRFVIDTEGLIRVLDQLVHGQHGVVWFNDSIRHLGGWHDREGTHHTIRVLFTDLAQDERAHTYYTRIMMMMMIRDILAYRSNVPEPVPPPSEWVIWKP